MASRTRNNPSRPRVGDHCWFVDWYYELAFDSAGVVDPDRCSECSIAASSQVMAERQAKQAYHYGIGRFPKAEGIFGVVRYYEVVFTAYDEDDAIRFPHAGYWETIGEVYHYEGE